MIGDLNPVVSGYPNGSPVLPQEKTEIQTLLGFEKSQVWGAIFQSLLISNQLVDSRLPWLRVAQDAMVAGDAAKYPVGSALADRQVCSLDDTPVVTRPRLKLSSSPRSRESRVSNPPRKKYGPDPWETKISIIGGWRRRDNC